MTAWRGLVVNFSSERGRGEGKEMRYTVKIGTGYYSGSITRSIGLGWGVQSVHFSFVFRSPPHLGRGRAGDIWLGITSVAFGGLGIGLVSLTALAVQCMQRETGDFGHSRTSAGRARRLPRAIFFFFFASWFSVPLAGTFRFFDELISHFTSTVTYHLSLWVGDLTFYLGVPGVAFVFFFLSYFLTCWASL